MPLNFTSHPSLMENTTKLDMEKKQGTRKTQIGSPGRGNIGGLLLLGGAFAVGTLVAAFAARRRRDSNAKTSRSKRKEEQASHGLHFILPTSSPAFHSNQCCASNGSTKMVATQIEPSEMISTHSLILEENTYSDINSSHQNSDNDDQEILLTRESIQDSIEMRNNHYFVQELPLPELNNPSLYELEIDAMNDAAEETNLLATTEIAEEDAIDAEKTSIDMSSGKSTEEEEDEDDDDDDDDDDDEGEKKQAKEKLLLEENIKVEEKDEPIAVETSAEKTSSSSIEDDGSNLRKGLPFMAIIEVRKEEAIDEEEEDAIDAVKKSIEEILSVQSTIEEEDDVAEENKQASEKVLLEEKFEVDREEEPIGEKTCEERSSLNSVEEDDADDNFGKGLPLMHITEIKQEKAIDEVADVVEMSIEEISSVQSTEDDDDKEEDKNDSTDEKDGDIDERSDDEHILKKSEENSGETGSSSAGSNADEIWPAESVESLSQELMNVMINSRLSAEKTTEQDENNKTEEFSNFNRSKNDAINSCADINQTRRNSKFTKKEENLKFTVWNKQTATYLRKWRISIKHMLIMASIVLLLFTYCNALSYLSLRNDI